jgi:ankyrin repeat protein
VVKCLVLDLAADASPIDRWGNTPLDDAMRCMHGPVGVFLKSHGGVTHAQGGMQNGSPTSGQTPRSAVMDLCDAACSGDINKLALLIAGGLDVDQGNYDQRTALHLAASEGLLEVATYLVQEAGANHSPVDRWGGTPLDDSIRYDRIDVRRFLESKGARRGKHATASSACVLL